MIVSNPIFKDLKLKHKNGILSIRANRVSEENKYIQSLTLNGKPYSRNWLNHDDIFAGNASLVFEMGSAPNKNRGSSQKGWLLSMNDEKY